MELLITRSDSPVIMEGWQQEELEICQHRGVSPEELLVCTSGDCPATESKLACQNCITKNHFHNDRLQFELMSIVEEAIKPLKIMAERRVELEQRILLTYQRKYERMKKMLEMHRDILLGKLQLIAKGDSCQKIRKIRNGKFDDPNFLISLCQGKISSDKDKEKLIDLEVELLKSQIDRWEASDSVVDELAETKKRAREHPVEEIPKYKKRQETVRDVQPTVPSLTVVSSVPAPTIVPVPIVTQEKSLLTTQTFPVPNSFKDAFTQSSSIVEIDDEIPLTKSCRNFGEAIGCIHRYKSASEIELIVDEDRDAKEKGRYSSKYVYELSKLNEVQNLCLKFGCETTVSDWMLRKIDEMVSGLPKIKKFELHCWVSTPELTKTEFSTVVRKIGKDSAKIHINLRKVDSSKMRNTKTQTHRQ